MNGVSTWALPPLSSRNVLRKRGAPTLTRARSPRVSQDMVSVYRDSDFLVLDCTA